MPVINLPSQRAAYLNGVAQRSLFIGGVRVWEAFQELSGPSVDYFAVQRSTIPWYSSATGPTAAYDAASNTTFICWQAHDPVIDDRVTRATSYNHSTATWGDVVLIGLGNVQNDDHGVPALCILADGRIAIFWGTHNAPMDYAISNSPRSLAGFTNYRLEGVEYTYWRPVPRADGNIDLFCRQRINSQTRMVLIHRRITMATGVPTMGAESTVVDFGSDSRFYSGDTFRGDDGRIWMIATKANMSDSYRKNNYLLRIDTDAQTVTTLAGVSNAWPITATADDYLIYSHDPSTEVTGGIPSMARDAAGRIHVSFMTGAAAGTGGTENTSPQDLMHQIVVGTAVGTPFKIGDMDQRYESSRSVPLAGGALGVYFPSTEGVRGGSIVRRVFAAGSDTPGALETIQAYDPLRDPLGEIQVVQNAHPNFRIAFAEASSNDSDGQARDHRMWAHGDAGFVTRPITVPGQIAQPTVTGTDATRTVSWTAPFNGFGTISDYVLRLDGVVVDDGVGTGLNRSLTGLANGERSVTVAAVNEVGEGPQSDPVTFTVAVAAERAPYALTEGSGTTATSGDGVVSTINGATWAASPARLVFDGVDDFVESPAPTKHGTDYVVAVLVRLASVSGSRVLISRYGPDNNNQRNFQMRVNGGRIEWVSHADTTSGTTIQSASGAAVTNTWTIIAAYARSTAVTVTKDGVTVADGTHPAENRTLGMANVPIKWGARLNANTGLQADFLSGEIAAACVAYGASAGTMADVIAELRAIATAKGITLPA